MLKKEAMELDDIKQLLKHQLDEPATSKTDAALSDILKQSSKSIAGKLKRSIYFEIVVCVCIAICFGIVALTTSHWSFSIYFGFFSMLFMGFILILIYLHKKIKDFTTADYAVRQNLEKLYLLLVEFTKRYFQFSMLLLPVCFISSISLTYADKTMGGAGSGIIEGILQTPIKVWIFIICYFLILSVVMYFFAKWYIKKLYGNYIKELSNLLEELQSDDE